MKILLEGPDEWRQISGYLRDARLRGNLTQAVLAEKIGVPRSQISSWESGDRVPPLPALLWWVKALGIQLILDVPRDDWVVEPKVRRAP